jgi:hypothetical protein
MELLKNILRTMKGTSENEAAIQDVIENLKLISQTERHISEFYQLCGDVLAEEKDFWHSLAASERDHAEVALTMADLVAKEPGKYKPGRSFDALPIRLFGLHLDGLVESLSEGKLQKEELLSMAAAIESSVVELNYGDIVTTYDPKYLALVRQLEEETGEHRQAIEKRIKKG